MFLNIIKKGKNNMEFNFSITENNIKTFMEPGWRLLTVSNGFKMVQDAFNIEINRDYDIELEFDVDLQKCSNCDSRASVNELLKRLRDECKKHKLLFQFRIIKGTKSVFSVEQLLNDDIDTTEKVLKCKFPVSVHSILLPIFISSLVNYRAILEGTKKKNHKNIISNFEHESFVLDVDFENRKAILVAINLYKDDDNPFIEYARNSMIHSSFNAVVGENVFDSVKSRRSAEKIDNFYQYYSVKEWQPVEKLDSILVGDCINAIYMLYDENSQSFYVGKADDLKTRLVQHQTKTNDPIKNFTHFRYSLLNEEYAQYIYYIENAAIHDCAAILNMQNRKLLKSSLNENIQKGNLKGDMNQITMVNTAEYQTRERNKKTN